MWRRATRRRALTSSQWVPRSRERGPFAPRSVSAAVRSKPETADRPRASPDLEGVRGTEGEAEQPRQHVLAQALQRRRSVQGKLDRGYDDYLEGRISQAFWTRKSEEWEAEVFLRPTLRRSTSCHEVEKLGIGGVCGTSFATDSSVRRR